MLENHISSLFQYSFSVSQCHMSEMYIFQESLSRILRKNADFFDNYTSFSQIGEKPTPGTLGGDYGQE